MEFQQFSLWNLFGSRNKLFYQIFLWFHFTFIRILIKLFGFTSSTTERTTLYPFEIKRYNAVLCQKLVIFFLFCLRATAKHRERERNSHRVQSESWVMRGINVCCLCRRLVWLQSICAIEQEREKQEFRNISNISNHQWNGKRSESEWNEEQNEEEGTKREQERVVRKCWEWEPKNGINTRSSRQQRNYTKHFKIRVNNLNFDHRKMSWRWIKIVYNLDERKMLLGGKKLFHLFYKILQQKTKA